MELFLFIPSILIMEDSKTPHDVALTKSQGCAFSEFIRCLDNSHRSIHPLVSISSIGKCAFEITNENDHVSGLILLALGQS